MSPGDLVFDNFSNQGVIIFSSSGGPAKIYLSPWSGGNIVGDAASLFNNVVVDFVNPANPSQPATTSFFSALFLDRDRNFGTAGISAYDIDGHLVAQSFPTTIDTQLIISVSAPDIARVVLDTELAGANGFDNFTLNQVAPVPGGHLLPQPTPNSTAVGLVSFKAKVNDDGIVTVAWETASETNNAGFDIYRATRKGGSYVKINDEIIPAEGNATAGASYSYEDTPGNGKFYYKLEDVDNYGVSMMHGPVRVKVNQK